MNGDTIRWRGVVARNKDHSGLTIADLRAFLAETDAVAARFGISSGEVVPLVALNRDDTIRHIWAGVVRKRWRLRTIIRDVSHEKE